MPSNIDLSTGKIIFPLPIASISGPGNLEAGLSIQYSTSNLVNSAATWNQDAPTGVMGLGWSLLNTSITRLSGLGGRDDAYAFQREGKAQGLILKSSETRSGLVTNTYVTEKHSLWRIEHTSKLDAGRDTANAWNLWDENGTQYIFGNAGIAWGVRWRGQHDAPALWTGASAATTGQERYPLTWMLTRVEDMSGRGIDYVYESEEVNIGLSGAGLKYTRALYLSEITIKAAEPEGEPAVQPGESIGLEYAEKATKECPREWVKKESHGGVSNAYQGLRESKYLSRVTVKALSGAVRESIEFDYEMINESAAGDAHGSMSKRLLTGIRRLSPRGAPLEPARKFRYWGQDPADGVKLGLMENARIFQRGEGALFAHLKEYVSPEGAVTLYRYDRVGDASQSPNRLDRLDIKFPDNKEGGESVWTRPRPYWGPDGFIAIRWDHMTERRIFLMVCEWIGSWRVVFQSSYRVVSHDEKHCLIKTGPGILAILRTDMPTKINEGKPNPLIVVQRDPYAEGSSWHAHDLSILPVTYGVSSGHKFDKDENTGVNRLAQLEVGAHIVAVADQVNGNVFCFGMARRANAAGDKVSYKWRRLWLPGGNSQKAPATTASVAVAGDRVAVFVTVKKDAKHIDTDFRLYRFEPGDDAREDSNWTNLKVGPLPFKLTDHAPHKFEKCFVRSVSFTISQGYLALVPVLWFKWEKNTRSESNTVMRPIAISWDGYDRDFRFQILYNPNHVAWGIQTAFKKYHDSEQKSRHANFGVSDLLSFTNDSDKFLFRYTGESEYPDDATIIRNAGWHATRWENPGKNLPLLNMNLADDALYASESFHTYEYALFQFDPVRKEWLPQSGVKIPKEFDAMGFFLDLLDVLMILSIFIPVGGTLGVGMNLLFRTGFRAALGGMGRLAAQEIAEEGLAALAMYGLEQGGVLDVVLTGIMRSLHSGQDAGGLGGFDYLLVGEKRNSPRAYYRNWNTSRHVFEWISANGDEPLPVDQPFFGRNEKGGPVNNRFYYGSDFMVYGYRQERLYEGGTAAQQTFRYYQVNSDQVVFFRNGHFVRARRLPMTDASRQYDKYDKIPYMASADDHARYLPAAPWGGILAYLPRGGKTSEGSSSGSSTTYTYYPGGLESARRLALFLARDTQFEGAVTDFVVREVQVDDGYQKYRTFMRYESERARFHPLLNSFLFNQVSTAAGGEDFEDSRGRFGHQEYYYYNGGVHYPGSTAESGGTLPHDPSQDEPRYKVLSGTFPNLLSGECYYRAIKDNTGVLKSSESTLYDIHIETIRNRNVHAVQPARIATVTDGVSESFSFAYDFPGREGATEFKTGYPLAEFTRQFTQRDEVEELRTTRTYGIQEYPEMAAVNLFTPVVQTSIHKKKPSENEWQAFSSDVSTFRSYHAQDRQTWMPAAAYRWRGLGPGEGDEPVPGILPEFPFQEEETHGDYWLRQARAAHVLPDYGLTLESRDAADMPLSIVLDTALHRTVAIARNVSLGRTLDEKAARPKLFVCASFEKYEDLSPWDYTKYDENDYYAGSRSLELFDEQRDTLYYGDVLEREDLNEQYVLGLHYKTSGGGLRFAFELTGSYGFEQSYELPDTKERWEFVLLPVDLSEHDMDLSLTTTFRLKFRTTLHGQVCLMDSMFFIPARACDFSMMVHDSDGTRALAEFDSSGRTRHFVYLYDKPGECIGEVVGRGADQQVLGLMASFYSRAGAPDDAFQASEPNSRLDIRVRNGGPYFDFRHDERGGWEGGFVADNALRLDANKDEAYLILSVDGGNCGIRLQLQVQSPGEPVEYAVELGFLKVSYADGRYRMKDMENGHETEVDSSFMASDWILMTIDGHGYFFADGRPLMNVPVSGDAPAAKLIYEGGSGNAVYNRDIMVFYAPIAAMTFLDGAGKIRQTQSPASIAEGETATSGILISENLYDALERSAFETITVRKGNGARHFLGFEEDFVRHRDPSGGGALWNPASGKIEGSLVDWLPAVFAETGNENYAYSGTYYYPDLLSRVLRETLPAVEYTFNGSRTSTYTYGEISDANIAFLSEALGMEPSTLLENYSLDQVRTPLGETRSLTQINIATKSGRTLGGMSVDESNRRVLTGYEYDLTPGWESGAPIIETVLHASPNHYDSQDEFIARTELDALGRVISTRSPDEGRARYHYDDAHRPRFFRSAYHEARGFCLYMEYDAPGRMTRACVFEMEDWDAGVLDGYLANPAGMPDMAVLLENQYDFRTMNATDIKDETGRVVKTIVRTLGSGERLDDARLSVQEEFYYDHRGRLKTCIARNDDLGMNLAAGYAYDHADRITEIKYPGRPEGEDVTDWPLRVKYGYNTQGGVASIRMIPRSGSSRQIALHYNPDLSPAFVKWSDRVVERRTHDTLGKLTNIDSGNFQETISYEDSSGNPGDGLIARIQNSFPNSHRNDLQDYEMEYTYDSFGRLVQALRTQGSGWNVRIGAPDAPGYDANGNILKLTRETTRNYTYNGGTNQVSLTSDSMESYTYSGGLVTGMPDKPGFRYDLLNQLPAQAGMELLYNSSGRRVFHGDANGEGTHYFPGPTDDPLLRSRTSRGELYVYGPGGPLALWVDNGMEHGAPQGFALISDHQGSTRMLREFGGDLRNFFNYDAFGVLKQSSGDGVACSLLFTGQEWDEDLELYNYKARLYDPELGRFLAPDLQGEYASPYLYVGNDPVNYVDPNGEIGTRAGRQAGRARGIKVSVHNIQDLSLNSRNFRNKMRATLSYARQSRVHFITEVLDDADEIGQYLIRALRRQEPASSWVYRTVYAGAEGGRHEYVIALVQTRSARSGLRIDLEGYGVIDKRNVTSEVSDFISKPGSPARGDVVYDHRVPAYLDLRVTNSSGGSGRLRPAALHMQGPPSRVAQNNPAHNHNAPSQTYQTIRPAMRKEGVSAVLVDANFNGLPGGTWNAPRGVTTTGGRHIDKVDFLNAPVSSVKRLGTGGSNHYAIQTTVGFSRPAQG